MSQDHGYTCQRCRQPLLLDASLSDLSQSQYDIIAGSLPPEEDADPASSLSPLEKLAKIPAQPESKAAYLSTLVEREKKRREGGPKVQRHGTSVNVGIGGHRHPGESYILLSQSQIGPSVPLPKPKTGSQRQLGTHNERRGNDTSTSKTSATANQKQKQNLTASLLSLLTSRTPHDHPLCGECARALQYQLQSRLEDAQRERDVYISFERNFQEGKRRRQGAETEDRKPGEDVPLRTSVYETYTDDEYRRLQQRKADLEATNATLLAQLEALEMESAALAEEERLITAEEAALEAEERAFLVTYHEAQQAVHDLEDELATEETAHLLATQTLQRLETANVYNDVFQIGHVPLHPTSPMGRATPVNSHAERTGRTAYHAQAYTGQTVGTINGLRLGGRPVVDWVEINAALGLVALCIDRVAVKVGCQFETYKIIPFGSFSRVDELPPSKNTYELFASTDLSAARLLQNRRFNYALVGMLDCLRQLLAFGKTHGRGWAGGGIEIHRDKIAGHSIKLSANMGMSSIGLVGSVSGGGSGSGPSSTEAEESWTRALRAVLAVLKRILVIESEADRENER
ncbi:hypothetical protein NliqN6_0363 [Naganishia liquefaciens]|uniref:Autophagy-related protein 6 n=1 Tax=Naganishia liquefaciens TaxID=104408 RepID=A0A8H3TNG1_9TREE|nr:hypothetical protein NliqN6_0363 [Naganishia liquefaciens]